MSRRPGELHAFKTLWCSKKENNKDTENTSCDVSKNNQLCEPVGSPDWYIMFALQQWNIHLNGLVEAISFGVNFVQGLSVPNSYPSVTKY